MFKNPALVDKGFTDKGFTVSERLKSTDPATAGNYVTTFWIAPARCVVDSVEARWAVASSSGTLQVAKVPSGTAADSGTDLLASTISTAGTADTTTVGTLSTTDGDHELAAGDALQLVDGGTLTNLTELQVTVGLHWIP